MYFDSHAHYDDKKFDIDRDELLKKLNKEGVDYIVNAGTDVESSIVGIELAEKYSFIYTSVGVHPHEAKSLNEENYRKLVALCENEKVVAVGEIGLDYHYDFSKREVQREWFEKQLELAKIKDLPVIIHSREASQDTFDMIVKAGLDKRGDKGAGVIHSFSGSLEIAREYIKLGYYIGIGGVITFSNAKKLREIVQHIPLSSILIETDCPYLAPSPNRGKRNDSQNLKYIVDKISEIIQKNHEEVADVTKRNALRLFDLN